MADTIEFEGKTYDRRHGGPFDRGSADSYYGRSATPHYYVGKSYMSDVVMKEEMTLKEIYEYLAGYDWNEKYGDKKQY